MLTFEQLEPRRLLSGTHLVLHEMDLVEGPEQYVWTEGMPETTFTYSSPAGPVEVTILSDQSPGYTVLEDTVLVVNAADGVSGGLPGVVLVAGPTHADMMLDGNGEFIFAPHPNRFGLDHFIHSRDGVSSLTTVLVAGVNDAPTAVGDLVDGVEDTPLIIDVLANDWDLDGDELSIDSFTQPEKGVVTHDSGGLFTYTPVADFFGEDSFKYVAADGDGATGEATVTIDVRPVNDVPVANPDEFTTRVRTPLAVQSSEGPMANDVDIDGDTLSGFTIVSQPSHGEVTATSRGAFLYMPEPGYVGLDVFSYTISDEASTSESATVTITIVDSNLPRVRSEVYLSGPDGITVDAAMGVLANDSGGLTASIVVLPSHGILVMEADGSFTYVPPVGFVGAVPFTYRATDPDGLFGEVQSAIWVQATGAGFPEGDPAPDELPSLVPVGMVERPPLAPGGGFVYDVVAFSQNLNRSNWDPVLQPEYVDHYYGGMA